MDSQQNFNFDRMMALFSAMLEDFIESSGLASGQREGRGKLMRLRGRRQGWDEAWDKTGLVMRQGL